MLLAQQKNNPDITTSNKTKQKMKERKRLTSVLLKKATTNEGIR